MSLWDTLSPDLAEFTYPLLPEVTLRVAPQHATPAPLGHGADWAAFTGPAQLLGRYMLDNPTLFQGARVVELGAGGGGASIAAKLAGASSVLAVDINADARTMIAANAALNEVTIEVSDTLSLAGAGWLISAMTLGAVPDAEQVMLSAGVPVLYATTIHELVLQLQDPAWTLIQQHAFVSQAGTEATLGLWEFTP